MAQAAPIPQLKKLRIGHTPDPDDAFMFYGFATQAVTIPGFEIVHVLEDIQSLNQKAFKSEIEVTAISAAAYPRLQNKYWILPIGASVGRNYGPVVVKLKGATPKTKRIGIPGRNTTANLLLQLFAPGYTTIEYSFDKIPEAIKKGEVDYGLLIHEAQLTYESMGFEKIINLGEAWHADTHLPIPLGLDVINKDLGEDLARRIGRALKKSIEIARENPAPAVEYALKYGRGLKKDLGHQFVNMYVNDDTLDLGEEGEKALGLLFDRAYRAGLVPTPTIVDVLRLS